MNEPSGASGGHAVNVGQELASRLKALNDQLIYGNRLERITSLEAEVARLRLTDEEQDDLRVWLAECLRQASTATEGANVELSERWQERAKRAAAMIERTGGGR